MNRAAPFLTLGYLLALNMPVNAEQGTLESVAAPAGSIAPRVRASVSPRVVTVGEPINLTITVLVPTWFSRPSVYPSFELPNTIVRLPDDSTYPGGERVDGNTWSSILRDYRIYPMLAANYRISNRSMKVTYAHPQTRTPVEAQIPLPEVSFQAVVPPGAESLEPFLAGRDLILRRRIEGLQETLNTGDAVTLHYSAQLEGMPVLFLPPMLTDWRIENASAYLGEPVLEETQQQSLTSESSLVSKRSEKLTLVFDSAGTVILPELALRWWNTQNHQIEKATVPGMTFQVAALPNDNKGGQNTGLVWFREHALRLASALLIMSVLLVSYMPLRKRLAALRVRLAAGREKRHRSEAYAFQQLRKALAKADSKQSHRALLFWLQRLTGNTRVSAFAEEFGSPQLCQALAGFTSYLYDDNRQKLSSVELARREKFLSQALSLARRRYLAAQRLSTQRVLSNLNPR